MYDVKSYLSEMFLSAAIISLVVFGYVLRDKSNTESSFNEIAVEIPEIPVLRYGMDVNAYDFEEHPIRRGSFLGDILMSYGVDFDKIVTLERNAENVFSLRKIMAGKNITLVSEKDCETIVKFVYEPDRYSFVMYDLTESLDATLHKIPFETCVETASGIVSRSLYNSFEDAGIDMNLFDNLEIALAQVDFFASQKGDQFRFTYEQRYIEGLPAGVGKVLAASYKSGNSEEFSFYFENDKYKGYYDMEGTPTQRTFMRDPVNARISSRFNMNRFHPILKKRRPHLGTDYAAPTGTPIMSVADGTIIKRSYTKGNGNYIKIRHNNTYETQYLHMSKFVKGLGVGSRVTRGQVIGYVGSTGLATGPHVCFRFWKNGRQINHLRENFPPLDPMAKEELPEYLDQRDELLEALVKVAYQNEPMAFAGLGISGTHY